MGQYPDAVHCPSCQADDTKVVDSGHGDGVYINTAGIGLVDERADIRPQRATPGDVVIISGDIGVHGVAVMSCREGLEFATTVASDTAPLHGFRDAEDYWARCSALFSLEGVRCPALLLSAEDDPFLAEGCFPRELARAHPFFHLETPAHGGHVGFVGSGHRSDEYFSERRAVEFLQQVSVKS